MNIDKQMRKVLEEFGTEQLSHESDIENALEQIRSLYLSQLERMLDVEKIADVLDTELPWLKEDLLKLATKIKAKLEEV